MSKSRIILLLLLIYPAYLTVHYGIRNYAESQIRNEVLAEIAKDPQLVSVFGGPYERATSISVHHFDLYGSLNVTEKFIKYAKETSPVNGLTYSILDYEIVHGEKVYKKYQLSICGAEFCAVDPENVIQVTQKEFDVADGTSAIPNKIVTRHEVRYGHKYSITLLLHFNIRGQSKGYAAFLISYPETFWDRKLREFTQRSPESGWARIFYSVRFETGIVTR